MTAFYIPEISDRFGWKIHLNIPRDRNTVTAGALVKLCLEEAVNYKIGRDGDQNGKGMTIYTGIRKNVERIAEKIENLEATGKLPELAFAGTDVISHDMPIGPEGTKVWGRFDAGVFADMHQYGQYGLPFQNTYYEIHYSNLLDKKPIPDADKKSAWLKSYRILEMHLGEAFTGVPTGQRPEWSDWAFDETRSVPIWKTQTRSSSALPDWLKSQIAAGLVPTYKK